MMDRRIRNPEDSEHNFGYFTDFGGNFRFLYVARSNSWHEGRRTQCGTTKCTLTMRVHNDRHDDTLDLLQVWADSAIDFPDPSGREKHQKSGRDMVKEIYAASNAALAPRAKAATAKAAAKEKAAPKRAPKRPRTDRSDGRAGGKAKAKPVPAPAPAKSSSSSGSGSESGRSNRTSCKGSSSRRSNKSSKSSSASS